ncbi:MAG: methionyl-tRNA formyltransferase [Balneolales bacterium]|nr:methionyl-tRNA formyltransferase [Balneolales bacterium]
MRIVFMGSPDFAVSSLELLMKSGHDIVAVVTGPDKKRGRGSSLSPTPVKAFAQKHDTHVIETDDLRSVDFIKELKDLKADLFVVVAFRVLPAIVLKIPTIGSINLHASLLPAYRGAAPIHRAVMNGECETGLTVFFLDERVDTGRYLMQKRIQIGSDETTGELYERMMIAGAEVLEESIRIIATGNYATIPQDDSKATTAPKLFPEDCRIDFSKPAVDVHNQIRGLSPFPCAFTFVDKKRLKVYRSAPGPSLELPDNQLVPYDGKLLVSCRDKTTVELLEVQMEGKKPASGYAFWNGYQGQGRISQDS